MFKKFAKVNPEFRHLQCNGITIRAKVATTNEDRMKGLAGVAALSTNEGMLFDFGAEQPVSFWMRGCTAFDISVAFMTNNKIIVGMQDMSKDAPTHLHNSPMPVRYALEVPKGFFVQNSISVGDKVSF